MKDLDVCLLVPLQPIECGWLDDLTRQTQSSVRYRAVRALHELEEWVGRPLRLARDADLDFYADARPRFRVRTPTSVVLATSLEAAGLAWRVLDPAMISLGEWRRKLTDLRRARPRVIAISTTYVTAVSWLGALCALVRELLPEATVLVGGPLYTTDARSFLALDADIFLIGEGETRIVDVIAAVRDGRRLDDIPGLFLRRADGTLYATGVAAPLAIGDLPLPDWSLCNRIEPPVEIEKHGINAGVETQRGCCFKCEFCTFRTSVALSRMPVEMAAQAILNAARTAHGVVFIVDATATFPRDRWRELMEVLAARGGARCPVSAYARVSDIDPAVIGLMEQAGIRHLYVGQESGDQRILNAMRKGTRVDQVAPAVRALIGSSIVATFSFIHGFPGEDQESVRATRELLLSLNAGAESSPVVPFAMIDAFRAQDFAVVTHREGLRASEHQYSYDAAGMSPKQAAEETLETYLVLSRSAHAPATGFGFNTPNWGRLWGLPDRRGLDGCFHWLKAIDRGMGIFLAAALDGQRPDGAELGRVRERILANYPADRRRSPLGQRLRDRLRNRVAWRLTAEWDRERDEGVGPLTRMLLARESFASSRSLAVAARSLTNGAFGNFGRVDERESREQREARLRLSEDLIRQGTTPGNG